jgi:hypothetical protein
MPTITTDNQQSRYRTAKDLRNKPRDDVERDLQAIEASEAIDRFLQRYPNEVEFQKQLALALGKRVLGYDVVRPEKEDLE